jgi:hypothetical protein
MDKEKKKMEFDVYRALLKVREVNTIALGGLSAWVVFVGSNAMRPERSAKAKGG